MLEWKDEYNTGVSEIDLQHKTLFGLLRDLNDSHQKTDSQKQAKECVKYLDDYIKMHFSFEEGCMHASKCPAALQNKSQHQAFIKEYSALRDDLEKNNFPQEGAQQLSMMIAKWFIKHILSIDIQLNSCMH